MRKSQTSRLPLRTPLPFAVYHDSGKLLHTFGDQLTDKHLFLMDKAGIEEVMLADRLDRPARIQEDLKVKAITNMVLARGQTIARPVYTDDGQMIIDAGTRVNEEIFSVLQKFSIKQVHCQKRDTELNYGQVTKYQTDVKKHIDGGEPIPGFNAGGATALIEIARDLGLVRTLEELGPAALRVAVAGEPLSKRLPPPDPGKLRTREDLDAARKVYDSCIARIEQFHRSLATGRPVAIADIDALIGEMLRASLRDRSLILAILHQPREGEYLFAHAMNVFVLAVNVAIQLDYDEKLLKEVCYAAFFNDIGMLLVADAIRAKPSRLTDEELAEVRNHPTYSLRLASKVEGVPQMLPLVLFQTHELLDGAGYPRQKKGDEIHDLARVVSVADCYAARISNRPYRKGEQPYKALEEVIHMAGQRKFDLKVVRGLLQTVNLFPVGSWVRMNDASSGVVVCPNPGEYARPFVRLILDRMGKPVPDFPLVTAESNPGLHIERAIDAPSGIPALLAFFSRKT
jgi:HD-GYP domain-containing protein (c-di-GMP phosphodiesterase class II)